LLGAASVDELLGQNIAGRIYAEPDARIQLLDEMERNGFVEDFEVDLRRKDGSVVTVSTNSHYYFDSSGEFSGVEGIFRDMMERKAADELLNKSEHRLMDIISFLPDATVVIDKNGEVIAWNRAMEEMTGVPAGQMIGKGNYEYALPFYHERRPITIDLVLHDDPAVEAKYPVMKMEVSSRIAETFIPHLNKGRGAYLWFVATPLYDTDGNLTGAIESIRDITGHKPAEDNIKASRAEKIILLCKIHHRVNNNLQIIISLVNLQMRHMDDERLKQVMAETQNRLRTMAFVQEKLYQSEDISHIDLASYSRFLVTHLFSFHGVDSRLVALDVGIGKIMLDINTAIPLGLIIHELAGNALQHAFPKGRKGTLSLTVNDDGIGLPADFDWRHTESLGFQLVISLVEQLDGTIELDRSAGTRFTILVKEMG
jgi:two-component sensor histidine kinase